MHPELMQHSPLAPLALVLAGTTFCICTVVIGYFEVYICILLPIMGQRNQLIILCHNYAHVYAYTASSQTMLFLFV